MLGKQAWRLAQNPNALWSQILKEVYFPEGDVWKAKRGHHPSWGWQSLLAGREAIESEVKWVVGDSQSIRIREDKWLSSGKYDGLVNNSEPRLVAGLINQETHTWNTQRVAELYSEDMEKEILEIPLSQDPLEDGLVWTDSKEGKYSVKAGYNKIRALDEEVPKDQASTSYTPQGDYGSTCGRPKHIQRYSFSSGALVTMPCKPKTTSSGGS